ncbi:hypothetical protein [Mycobacterium paraterrae]|uniref:Uncharacterized protein n=1 Tax=Mycobacterium paraterrae TaxID=577492 RepID=A0ABY3VNG1_9MYCO|nr:hypothetical protein [Mycobacterium paraterrae]UMB69023.1 hypothetical protein MKK62_22015 [Mycobacterium paraterrae]
MPFAVAVVSPPGNPTVGGAFREVAEGLHYALRALGYDSVLTDRLDLDDRRTIVLGANHLVHYGLQAPTNPVFYNLEQLGDDSPWMAMPDFVDLFRRYPTWDYSLANIEYLARLGLPRPTYVPIGYVPELTRIAPAVEDIDVLFYGVLSERRYAVLRKLRDRGLRVKWLSGVLGASRDAWIARSKIVINIHYWDAKIFEIARVSYLLANKRAVVSERGADSASEHELKSGVAFADYDGLVDRCAELLRDDGARHELAERGYQIFTSRSQADILRHALPASLDNVNREAAAPQGGRIDVHPMDPDSNKDHQLRNRNLLRHKSEQERDQLLAEVERDPDSARPVLFLAETCFQLEEFVDARRWYARRAEMGGCEEEVYWAMYRLAASMAELDEPWPEVHDAYIKAWEFRPTRAEALHAIAFRCRNEQRYQLGYLYARRATETPFPENDLFVLGYSAEIYTWRAADEQATCAFWIGRRAEAFTLCRRLLARPDIPEDERQRIATNRDYSVPAMLEATQQYPAATVARLANATRHAEVTVSLITGTDPHTTGHTINTFLNCCLDAPRIGRFLALDTGLTTADRATLQQRYKFLEFIDADPGVEGTDPSAHLTQLRAHIHGRLWLHLGHGWRFFAPDHYITRLTAVLDAEPQVVQVGINLNDAAKLTGTSAAEKTIRRAPNTGRYLLTTTMATGPAMHDTTRLHPTTDTTPHTATLDEVLCTSTLN